MLSYYYLVVDVIRVVHSGVSFDTSFGACGFSLVYDAHAVENVTEAHGFGTASTVHSTFDTLPSVYKLVTVAIFGPFELEIHAYERIDTDRE